MKVYPGLWVVLAVLAMPVSVHVDTPGSQALSAQNSQVVAPQVSTASAGLPDGTRSAGSLLRHAVYDTQVKTYGRVSGLGEMSCPCFTIASDGERLEVWYDLTAQEPAAQVPAIQNGDWIVVTGQLKAGILGMRSRTFWASHIERLLEP